jgi:hypothetical protein
MSVRLVHPHPDLGDIGTMVTDPDLEGQLIQGGYAIRSAGSRSAARKPDPDAPPAPADQPPQTPVEQQPTEDTPQEQAQPDAGAAA